MPTTTFIERYFNETIEYPDPVAEMMRPGVFYEYISGTFLTGWINYVEIRSAFLITRYREHAANVAAAKKFNAKEHPHADLGTLTGDDVFVLATAKHEPSQWWLFWNDRDSSDCCIGRFETKDAPGEVLRAFQEWADATSMDESGSEGGDSGPALQLDPGAFSGWITF